jgi:hypothetical protein
MRWWVCTYVVTGIHTCQSSLPDLPTFCSANICSTNSNFLCWAKSDSTCQVLPARPATSYDQAWTDLPAAPACLPDRPALICSCVLQRQSRFDSAEYFMGKEGKQPTDSFALLASTRGSQPSHAFEVLPLTAHTAKPSRLSACAK